MNQVKCSCCGVMLNLEVSVDNLKDLINEGFAGDLHSSAVTDELKNVVVERDTVMSTNGNPKYCDNQDHVCVRMGR